MLKELSRRASAGEYILQSENPSMVRTRQEMLKHALENSVPPIMAARQDFLASLNLDQDAISKLTNHAAKIAEASFTVGPMLGEISTAKVEYDAKARELLTPEQYEKFKEFETRQALQKEWQRYGVQGLDNLPLTDLKAISRSLEELGVREKASSTVLPYEPEPSSGNWITGENTDLREIMLSKISRLDAAAADVGVIAERNQLSNEAREALASMIANRRSSITEQMNALARSEEESRARFRATAEARFGPPPKP